MKKKFLVALLLALGVCSGAFALSACNSGNNDNSDNPSISDGDTAMSVSGKKFDLDNVSAEFLSEVPDSLKESVNGTVDQLNQDPSGIYISFRTDGTADFWGNGEVSWVQDGDTITITFENGTTDTITIKNDSIVVVSLQGVVKMTMVFKYNPGGGTENPGGGTENPGSGADNPGGGDHGGGADNPGSGGNNSSMSDTEWEAALNFTKNTNYTLVQDIRVMGMSMSVSIEREGNRAKYTNTDGSVTYYCEREGSYYYVDSSGAYSQITETEYNAFFSQLQSFPRDMFEYNSAKGGFVNKATYEVKGATISNVVLVFDQQGCVQTIQCTMAQSGVTAALNVSVVYGNASVTLPDFKENGEKPGEENPGDKPESDGYNS